MVLFQSFMVLYQSFKYLGYDMVSADGEVRHDMNFFVECCVLFFWLIICVNVMLGLYEKNFK